MDDVYRWMPGGKVLRISAAAIAQDRDDRLRHEIRKLIDAACRVEKKRENQ
jgi:hypothetical protein